MTSLDLVKKALQKECGIDPNVVDEQTNLLSDLDIDSLDLLKASFLIESECAIALPVQQWLAEEYGDTPIDTSRFIVSEICAFIDQGIFNRQKQAAP